MWHQRTHIQEYTEMSSSKGLRVRKQRSDAYPEMASLVQRPLRRLNSKLFVARLVKPDKEQQGMSETASLPELLTTVFQIFDESPHQEEAQTQSIGDKRDYWSPGFEPRKVSPTLLSRPF